MAPADGRLKIKLDWISIFLLALLAATLLAFFSGLIPYPVGWIVISALLVFRSTAKQSRE